MLPLFRIGMGTYNSLQLRKMFGRVAFSDWVSIEGIWELQIPTSALLFVKKIKCSNNFALKIIMSESFSSVEKLN